MEADVQGPEPGRGAGEQAARGAGGQRADEPQREAAVSVLAAALEGHLAAGPGHPPPPVIDAVVATLAASSAQALLDALLALRWCQPGLAAHLLLRGLGPAGWELLSGSIERRQEELAQAGEGCGSECCFGRPDSCLTMCWLLQAERWVSSIFLFLENGCCAPSPAPAPVQALQRRQRRRWAGCATSCTAPSPIGRSCWIGSWQPSRRLRSRRCGRCWKSSWRAACEGALCLLIDVLG